MNFDAPGSLRPFRHYTPDWFERLQTLRAARLAKIELLRRERAKHSLIEFVKINFADYLAGWVHEEICAALDAFIQAVAEKRSPRLMINLPPRHGKSHIVSRSLPPYILGLHPAWEVILATAGAELASDFGKDARSIFENPLYTEIFPLTVLEGTTHAADNMTTTRRGSFRAVGVGGQLVGRGAHILVCDDLFKDAEAADSEVQRDAVWKWFTSVARTRLAPGGGLIMMGTRWNQMDVFGRICELETKNPEADQYTKFVYPAIAIKDEPHRKIGEALHPERWSVEELMRLKNTLSPREWSCLFQQDPTPEDGNFILKEYLRFYRVA